MSQPHPLSFNVNDVVIHTKHGLIYSSTVHSHSYQKLLNYGSYKFRETSTHTIRLYDLYLLFWLAR